MPNTTTVPAIPVASVAALAGVSVMPPPPLAVKFTVAPLTACPFASDTLTANVPIEPFTEPVVVGGELTSTRAGGPILGPDESEHAVATKSSEAAEAARNEDRITLSAR